MRIFRPPWPRASRQSRCGRRVPDRDRGESSVFQGVADVFFPARCQGCNQQTGPQLASLCDTCRARLSPLTSPLCTCCGTIFTSGEDHLCGACLGKTFAFSRARSLFSYKDPLRSLLVRLKFGGDLSVLETLATLARQAEAEQAVHVPDCLIPVPLHKKRLQRRGFNQALLLARACFPAWQAALCPNLLCRHRSTVPQTELSGKARRNNLKNSFSLREVDLIRGRKVLLVDDVYTTGSTLHECARVLVRAGAERVEAFTVARVL